jgi:tetratricopeptide (TPR) repeat protein
MILLLMAAAAANPPSPEQAHFAACVAMTESEPARAVVEAEDWRIKGGGVLARQCLGLAFAAQARWLPALSTFEEAAREAERNRDGRAARLWVQAGNAALAGGEYVRARQALDAAIIGGQLQGAEAGEAYLDRGRVLVALKQPKEARSDFDRALKLVPADPLAWLLSATLARKAGDMARASTDITEAARLSPDDAGVALEAGNIAVMSGANDAAKLAWAAAVKAAPNSPAGKAAAEALKQFQ